MKWLPKANKHKSGIFIEKMQNHPWKPVVTPVAVDQEESLNKTEPECSKLDGWFEKEMLKVRNIKDQKH